MKENFMLRLVLSLALMRPAAAIYKCNTQLLNHFYLTGTDYVINEKMKVCSFVSDKCCTLADELKISRLWNERSEPFINGRIAIVTSYIVKTIESYWDLMKVDPDLMVLKYTERRNIPIDFEYCQESEKPIDKQDMSRLEREFDRTFGPFYEFIDRSDPDNRNKLFDLKKFTHEDFGKRERHWHVEFSKPYVFGMKKLADGERVPEYYPPEIYKPVLHCQRDKEYITKEFVIVNRQKAAFCMNIYEKFFNFDARKFLELMSIVKASLTSISNLKRTTYCFLCDVHSQKNFDVTNKRVVFANDFCQDLLQQKKDYLHFIHVAFVEFVDNILQYISCFETDGRLTKLPYENFIVTKYKRRIPLIKKCLDSVSSGAHNNYCWFLCNQFSLTRFSSFWEGDLVLLERIFTTLQSFFRKLDIERHEEAKFDKVKHLSNGAPIVTYTGNEDGLVKEPLIEVMGPQNLVTKENYDLIEPVKRSILAND